jgi:hypothetical protein
MRAGEAFLLRFVECEAENDQERVEAWELACDMLAAVAVTVQRRKAAGTLWEGSCRAAEVAWCAGSDAHVARLTGSRRQASNVEKQSANAASAARLRGTGGLSGLPGGCAHRRGRHAAGRPSAAPYFFRAELSVLGADRRCVRPDASATQREHNGRLGKLFCATHAGADEVRLRRAARRGRHAAAGHLASRGAQRLAARASARAPTDACQTASYGACLAAQLLTAPEGRAGDKPDNAPSMRRSRAC